MVEPVNRLELMNKISDIIFDRPYDDFFKGVEAAMRVVADAPLTQQKQQWVPCSEFTAEGYPKENGLYYVTEQNYGFLNDADKKERVVHTSYFNGDFTNRVYEDFCSNITAWMPFCPPEPYTGG